MKRERFNRLLFQLSRLFREKFERPRGNSHGILLTVVHDPRMTVPVRQKLSMKPVLVLDVAAGRPFAIFRHDQESPGRWNSTYNECVVLTPARVRYPR